MATMLKGLTRSWIGRGVVVLALVLLSVQAAAADNSAATITLFAPGAPAGAIAAVEYQNPAGEWFTVVEWQHVIDATTNDKVPVPFEQWTVSKDNFGQGPFRWAVYQPDGKTLWAISDIFVLPRGGGINQSVTIRLDNLAPVTPVTTPTTVQTAVSQAASVPVLKGGSELDGVTCTNCKSHAHISAFITGVPVSSWVAVEWQDGLGNWQTVPGWQGNAHFLYDQGKLKDFTLSGKGSLYLQWSVLPANYGQGPFRWAVYSQPNGSLVAVSPSFKLPTYDGVNSVMTLSQ